MGTIWIESRSVPSSGELLSDIRLGNHYYLVYRSDDFGMNLTKQQQEEQYNTWQVIRGGPENGDATNGRLDTWYGGATLDSTFDRYTDTSTPALRRAELIDLSGTGLTAEQAWDAMSSYAQSIDLAYPYYPVDTLINYTTNSSSVIASALNSIGLSMLGYLDNAGVIDPVTASPGSQNLLGSAGNENLFGDNRDNSFFDVGGTDTFRGSAGANVIYNLGDGHDFASYQYHANPQTIRAVVSGGQSYWQVGTDKLYSIELVEIGADYSKGGLYVEVESNSITSSGPTISLNANKIKIDGIKSTDTINVSDFFLPISVPYSHTTHVTINNNISVYSREGRGVYFVGDSSNNSLGGGAFDDFLYGGSGNDTLSGGTGNDWVYGDNGTDVLSGGAGRDQIYAASGFNQFGSDTVYAGNGDMLFGDTSDRLFINGSQITTITQNEEGQLVDNAGNSWVKQIDRVVINGTITINAPSGNPVIENGYFGLTWEPRAQVPVSPTTTPSSYPDTFEGTSAGIYTPPPPEAPYYRDGKDTYQGTNAPSKINGYGDDLCQSEYAQRHPATSIRIQAHIARKYKKQLEIIRNSCINRAAA